jgi:hypothetical protein
MMTGGATCATVRGFDVQPASRPNAVTDSKANRRLIATTS